MVQVLPLLLGLAGTLFMTGVIWFMQLLEYPLFAFVSPDTFQAYHAAHNRGLPALVFLPTLVTLGSVIALYWIRPPGVATWSVVSALALLIVTIISTAVWQAPLHQKLDRDGFSIATIHALVGANWLRTAAWTINAVLMLYSVARAIAAA